MRYNAPQKLGMDADGLYQSKCHFEIVMLPFLLHQNKNNLKTDGQENVIWTYSTSRTISISGLIIFSNTMLQYCLFCVCICLCLHN